MHELYQTPIEANAVSEKKKKCILGRAGNFKHTDADFNCLHFISVTFSLSFFVLVYLLVRSICSVLLLIAEPREPHESRWSSGESFCEGRRALQALSRYSRLNASDGSERGAPRDLLPILLCTTYTTLGLPRRELGGIRNDTTQPRKQKQRAKWEK